MGAFSLQLQKIRKTHFPRSAKEAWQHWQARGLQINYAFYMRVEQGKARPQPETVHQIASLVGPTEGEALIRSYCADLFPQSAYLFGGQGLGEKSPGSRRPSEAAPETTKQHFLNLRQIEILAATPGHYHLFLFATLARRPLSLAELSRFFKASELPEALQALTESKILLKVQGGYEAANPDVRFPAEDGARLKELYQRMDEWDREFARTAGLEDVLQKMILRRISFRYFGLIKSQLEGVFETIRCADELDTRYNDSVIQLQVVFKKGEIPG